MVLSLAHVKSSLPVGMKVTDVTFCECALISVACECLEMSHMRTVPLKCPEHIVPPSTDKQREKHVLMQIMLLELIPRCRSQTRIMRSAPDETQRLESAGEQQHA
mmetsp:Transcript_472/g.3492  ORF Transcript_472/g.3492 Transcript_472/m.3492 type:complete len:105 (-) Transcript_472:998-1312(-)